MVRSLPAKQELQVQSLIRRIPWRRAWQPTPVFLPGESHGQRSLVGYSPRSCKESDTEATQQAHTCKVETMPVCAIFLRRYFFFCRKCWNTCFIFFVLITFLSFVHEEVLLIGAKSPNESTSIHTEVAGKQCKDEWPHLMVPAWYLLLIPGTYFIQQYGDFVF